MNFTFYTKNQLETTGAVTFSHYDGSTLTTSNDLTFLLDNTSTSYDYLTISASHSYSAINVFFSVTSTVINSVQLKNINLKNFSFLVNGAAVSLSSLNGGTATASWTGFSSSNLILEFGSITSSSVSFRLVSVSSNDGLAQIGEIIINEKILRLSKNPAFGSYSPKLSGKKRELKTIDGGVITVFSPEKFNAKMKLEWVDASATADLLSLYNREESIYFVPYPTATSWAGESYVINWIGEYNFLENKYNYRGQPYYQGTMELKEVPL